MLPLIPYALMEPHTNQHLMHLQPRLGVGVRLKEHIIDPVDNFLILPFDQDSNFKNKKKMVADIIMIIISLSSVYNLVDGGDLSLVSFACQWKQSNKIKYLFSRFVMQEFIYALLMLAGSHSSHYFLNRVSNPFVLCRTSQSINKYLENKGNTLGAVTKEETEKRGEVERMQRRSRCFCSALLEGIKEAEAKGSGP